MCFALTCLGRRYVANLWDVRWLSDIEKTGAAIDSAKTEFGDFLSWVACGHKNTFTTSDHSYFYKPKSF